LVAIFCCAYGKFYPGIIVGRPSFDAQVKICRRHKKVSSCALNTVSTLDLAPVTDGAAQKENLVNTLVYVNVLANGFDHWPIFAEGDLKTNCTSSITV
jgi:hypothetical protein